MAEGVWEKGKTKAPSCIGLVSKAFPSGLPTFAFLNILGQRIGSNASWKLVRAAAPRRHAESAQGRSC